MPDQANIKFYPFSDGAALHKEGSHRLWVLNHSSAVLWCLYEEYGAGEALNSIYAEHFQIPVEQACLDVQTAFADFEQNGLLGSGGIENGTRDYGTSDQLLVTSDWLAEASARLSVTSYLSPVTCHFCRSYQVTGVCWQISSTDAAFAEQLFHCLKHLSVEDGAADLQFAVSRQDDGWTVTNGEETLTALADDEVLPGLLTMLFGNLCASLPQYLLLHAAVAVRDEHLLLFPGESTFGKSTLSAALAASGWTLFSDELAPLDAQNLTVAPFMLPVGIKPRSLPVLQAYYPDLADQPACRRADGQVVRYLSPPQINLADPAAKPAPVSALVFPRFVPDSDTRLEKLTPLQALELLANTGSSERPLRSVDVEALLQLAGERPCWSLRYADLGEAVSKIQGIFGRGDREIGR